MNVINQHDGSQEEYPTWLIQILQTFVHIIGRYAVSEFLDGEEGLRHGQQSHSEQWFIQVLEADALNVASIGRAVATGAEVWRGGVPGGTEAAGGGHQAADGGAGHLRPES